MGLIFGFGGIFALILVALASFGIGQLENEIVEVLNGNAVVKTRLGVVQSCSFQWLQNDEAADSGLIRYDCDCERSVGRFALRTTSTGADGAEQLVEGVLILDDKGDDEERVDLLPAPEAAD